MTETRESAGAAQAPAADRWWVLATCLGVGFITLLDVSIVNVAMPSIQHALHASAASLQLIVAGYTLAFGLVLVPAGRLGDAGRRRGIFLVGLVLFALTSLAAGLAPNDEWLAVTRLLQGASAGLLSPQVTGIIQQEFRGAERGRAFGMFGATIGVATAVGPLLGGVIIQLVGEQNGWRWVFGINVPIVMVLFAMALKYVPRPPGEGRQTRLDPVGLLLIAGATVAVMLPFVLTTGTGDSPQRWWWLAVAAALGAATIWWERSYQRRVGDAVLDPRVLGLRSFRNGTLLGFAYFAGFTSVFLVITLFLQNDLGLTALEAGLVGLPFAVASGFSALLSGRAVQRWGRPVVVAGLVVVAVGIAGTDLVIRTWDGSTWVLCVIVAATQGVAGAGSGFVIAPNQTLTLAEVPVVRAGVAGSVLQVGQRVGAAIGISAVLSVYYSAEQGGKTGSAAVGRGLLVTIALVLVALVVALVDTRARRTDDALEQTPTGPREGSDRPGPDPGTSSDAA